MRKTLKVPKREIFDRSDFPDFYTIKSSWVGDLLVKILTYVSPSDGDFVIGPCRLQRPGITAGNRQQQARDPGTQGVIREEDLGPASNSRRIPGSTPSDHERRAWAESTL